MENLLIKRFVKTVHIGIGFSFNLLTKNNKHKILFLFSYSREEAFTLISVDIRHSQNLKESLEQYVIGELLDGPNAYHCEKCNKKVMKNFYVYCDDFTLFRFLTITIQVDTIKRVCFKKLPNVLAIQLKRFDYDWERETPIKFNDYFEFPRELDMEPYTVQGLAKAEGTI